MVDKTNQKSKRKTVKDLNIYAEALEKRLDDMQEIFNKVLKLDPKLIEEGLKAEVKNANLILKLEKRVNTIDKKVKNIDSEKKEIQSHRCHKCEKDFRDNTVLKEHMKRQHPIKIRCRFCDETFQQTWMLELHIKSHVEKQFTCDVCSQAFHLKWRFNKHQEMHKNSSIKFCHYFNNKQECPFQELGCMFKHEMAPNCRYDIACNRQKCQFQHKKSEIKNNQMPIECPHCNEEINSNDEMTKHIENNHCLECGKCADVFLSENTLELHIKTNHAIINHQKTYPCEKCNFVFKSSERFDKHISGLQHNKVEKHDDSDYEDDSDDEEYVDSCSFCKAVLQSYGETDDHQSNYIRCEKCNVCFHNEFQWEDHVKCDIF